jgi:hypothetical protein
LYSLYLFIADILYVGVAAGFKFAGEGVRQKASVGPVKRAE